MPSASYHVICHDAIVDGEEKIYMLIQLLESHFQNIDCDASYKTGWCIVGKHHILHTLGNFEKRKRKERTFKIYLFLSPESAKCDDICQPRKRECDQ